MPVRVLASAGVATAVRWQLSTVEVAVEEVPRGQGGDGVMSHRTCQDDEKTTRPSVRGVSNNITLFVCPCTVCYQTLESHRSDL